MTNYLTLTEFVPGTKAKAQEVNANFTALKDAVNARALLNGDNLQAFNVADATLNTHAINKGQLDAATNASNTKMDNLLNRFCLKSGNITSGDADLLSYAGTTLSFKIGGSYPSVIWNSANGTQETISSLANITGFSTNGTYFIIKELGVANAISTSSKITQGKAFPASPSDGDYHCLEETYLKTYKRIGGAWVETQYIQLGTLTVSGNVITAVTTTPYLQNGYNINTRTPGALTKCWVSSEYTPVLATETVVTHNLNLANPLFAKADVLLKCIVAEGGYSVGDYVAQFSSDLTGNDVNIPSNAMLSSNTISVRMLNQFINIVNSSGSATQITLANWRYVFRIWY